MKDKILNFAKQYTKEIIIGILTIAFLSTLFGHIKNNIFEPEVRVDKKVEPVTNYQFDISYEKCMYESSICDPKQRHLTCVKIVNKLVEDSPKKTIK